MKSVETAFSILIRLLSDIIIIKDLKRTCADPEGASREFGNVLYYNH